MNPSSQPPLAPPAKYGRLDRAYQSLEYMAFGRGLERARGHYLNRLSDCRRIAIFGAGDGRVLAPLLAAAPHAECLSIDADAQMTRLAEARAREANAETRVRFTTADARTVELDPASFDALVTQFFLDCFTAEDLDRLIPKIGAALTQNGLWLFADFAIPARPAYARLRAKLWVALLCAFFRWRAGHPLRSLPPMEPLLVKHGFQREETFDQSAGLIRSAVYRRRQAV